MNYAPGAMGVYVGLQTEDYEKESWFGVVETDSRGNPLYSPYANGTRFDSYRKAIAHAKKLAITIANVRGLPIKITGNKDTLIATCYPDDTPPEDTPPSEENTTMTEDLKRFSLISEEPDDTAPESKPESASKDIELTSPERVDMLMEVLTSASFAEMQVAALRAKEENIPQMLARLKAFEGFLIVRSKAALLANSPKFSVWITGNPQRYRFDDGSSGYIKSIREIRSLTGLGLVQAKGIIDDCIKNGKALVRSGLPEAEARIWAEQLASKSAASVTVEEG